MTPRTPEFRQFLSASLDPDELSAEVRFDPRSSIDVEESERKRLLEEYERRLVDLTSIVDEFQERVADMDDSEFDHEFARLESEVNRFVNESGHTSFLMRPLLELREDTPENSLEKYQLSGFFPVREVGALSEFREKRIMWFEPRKEDICRLIFVAQELHAERVRMGEASPDDPISIVDVGGASGAMGALCNDVARENGLKIHYTVVDPHREIVEQAQSAYGDEIAFEIKTAHEYVLQTLQDEGDNESIVRIKSLDQEVQLVERRYKDFLLLAKGVEKIGEDKSRMFEDVKADVYRVLRQDFSMEPTVNKEPKKVWDLYRIVDDTRKQWLTNQRDIIIAARENLEADLARKPKKIDLVVNSWMPNQIDFTPDIRMLRGAGIFYAISGVGDTGIQERDFMEPGLVYLYTAIESSPDPRPGFEFSYSPGVSYEFSSAWMAEARQNKVSYYRRKTSPGERDWEFDCGQRHFLNQCVLQVAKGYENPSADDIKKHGSVAAGGIFPWEADMDEFGRYVPDPIKLSREEKKYRPIRVELQRYAESVERDIALGSVSQ